MGGFSDMGSKAVRSHVALDQNRRANSNQEKKDEDWEMTRELRKEQVDLDTSRTKDALLRRDVDATSYGDEYNYGLELKRRLDEKRNLKNMESQMKAMKHANQAANINAESADSSVIKYGVSGSEKDLSNVAKHTSGSNTPNAQGFYSVGPLQMRSVRPENMSARQRQEMDRIRQNRNERTDSGIYKEETFADGVKRYVNNVSNEVFGQDIWLEDDQGKLYTPEHIKMVTGQADRASQQYQSTQPQKKAEQPSAPAPTKKMTEEKPSGQDSEGKVEPVLSAQPSDNTQTIVPSVESASAYKNEPTDIGQMYTNYETQNPSFRKDMDKVTEQVSSFEDGTAGAELIKVIGSKGPEMDLKVKDAVEKYPTELGAMSPEQFGEFYKKQTTAAPATVKEAKADEPLETSLSSYRDKYISEKEQNANKPKGAQKATESQQKFMEVTNQPGAIERAIGEGVTNEAELHDWVAKKGKFKNKTATERKDKIELDLSNKMIDSVYTTDDKGTRFDTSKYANMSPKDAMKAQLRLGKPSDLKDMEKAYQGASEWYNVKDTIMSVSDKRLKLSEIGEGMNTMSDKWFGTFWEGEEGAHRFGQLEATMGKAVANQVKLMSGTAASDKERATILRYMFGDKGVSHESFIGAISGYTKMVEDKLPNQAETAFSKHGYAIGRKFSHLYEKQKGKSDLRPKKEEKSTETRLEQLKRLKAERQQKGAK